MPLILLKPHSVLPPFILLRLRRRAGSAPAGWPGAGALPHSGAWAAAGPLCAGARRLRFPSSAPAPSLLSPSRSRLRGALPGEETGRGRRPLTPGTPCIVRARGPPGASGPASAPTRCDPRTSSLLGLYHSHPSGPTPLHRLLHLFLFTGHYHPHILLPTLFPRLPHHLSRRSRLSTH